MLAAGRGKDRVDHWCPALGRRCQDRIRYAKHAAEHGADGLVSLPPGIDNGQPEKKLTPQNHLDYYKAVGAATDLPIMVQSHGDMSVDLIVSAIQAGPHVERTER